MVKGKGAKQRGSAFERKVRDELKRIYPADRRKAVGRIPMSGAGSIKGDILDQNNTDFCYECKKHERLSIPAWWRQTLAQTQVWQMPVLVFSSNYQPIYWVMRESDFSYCVGVAEMKDIVQPYGTGTKRELYKALAQDRPVYGYYPVEVNGENLAIVHNDYYIPIRRQMWTNQHGDR